MLIILVFLLFCPTAYALENKDCINAIIGEAESEPLEGQIAIGNAIRNRNSLKGVYGLHSNRVKEKKYSSKTYQIACKAWEASKRYDITLGATGWGNYADIVHFKTTKWFKKCVITCKICHHYFYKVKNV